MTHTECIEKHTELNTRCQTLTQTIDELRRRISLLEIKDRRWKGSNERLFHELNVAVNECRRLRAALEAQ